MHLDKYPRLSTYEVLCEVDQIMKHVKYWIPCCSINEGKTTFFANVRTNQFEAKKESKTYMMYFGFVIVALLLVGIVWQVLYDEE